MAQVTAQQQAIPREPGDHEPARRLELDERDFRSCPKFKGELGDWDNWRHSFVMCCYKVPALTNALNEVLRQAGNLKDITELKVETAILEKYRAMVYRFLVATTDGEALTLVRSIVVKGAAVMCGFGALALLSQRYNPKTPGRVLQHWQAVFKPGRVKDVRLLQQCVEQWEAKTAKLTSEYSEVVSDTLCVAILADMLPRDLQDIVFQSGKVGETLVYREVRDRIMAIASHRSYEMSHPVPMDVGCVDDHGPDDGTPEEADIDAISGECYNCGGWGHASRECPSKPGFQKGKGKGAKTTGGKSAGKSNNKGGKSGGKSNGKGFQGVCFRCQVKGHAAHECRAPAPVPVSEVSSSDPAESAATVASVGGCWTIGSVAKTRKVPMSAGTDWQAVRSKTPKSPPGLLPRPSSQGGKATSCPWFIGSVGESDVCAVSTDVTVDSAAEESVCPSSWGTQFGLHPVPAEQQMAFVNASGGRIAHYGSRKVVVEAASGKHLAMNFQVTDVKKPLLAVSRLIEHGNVVQFGQRPGESYIQNISTGDKLFLERRGNSWVIPGKLAAAPAAGF